MRKSLTVLVSIFFLLVPLTAYVQASPGCITHVSDSTSVVKNTDIWFRTCEAGSSEITGCPENQYITKRTYTCKTECIKCVPGASGTPPTCCDPPTCDKWETTGCTGEPKEEHICGPKNNSWTTVSTPGWSCPTCKDLALWHGGNPPVLDLSTFDTLSIRQSEYPLRSGKEVDFTFQVHIPACQDRIPMMNLKVKMINRSGDVESQETGIYAKHTTLDYVNEGTGLLENFFIPADQKELRKTYSIKGTLKAYRPWAWRQRLVRAINNIVSEKGLTIPGFPSSTEAQKIGDLYFSHDFLAGIDVEGAGPACEETFTKDQMFVADVLHTIPSIGGAEMCTVGDLKDYYSSQGLTPELKETIRSTYTLGAGSIEHITVEQGADETSSFNLNENQVDVTLLGYINASDFLEDVQSAGNYPYIFQKLRTNGVIEDSELNSGCRESMDFFDLEEKGCDSYTPSFQGFTAQEISASKTSDKLVNLSLKVGCAWDNDALGELTVSLETTYDCGQAWNWGSLADLSGETLAKCLYNWDQCLLNKHGNYYEAADCGMGPPSNLLNTTLKDAARGEKEIEFNVTVYRSCNPDEEWLTPDRRHACTGGDPIKKCKYQPSSDVQSFVKMVPVDTMVRVGSTAYFCNQSGRFEVEKESPQSSILINNGSQYTNSLQVNLTLHAEDRLSNISECRWRNDGGEWTPWQDCSSQAPDWKKNWTLRDKDGKRKVHFQVKDGPGNTHTSTDSITVDRTAEGSRMKDLPDWESQQSRNWRGERGFQVEWGGTSHGAPIDCFQVKWNTERSQPIENWHFLERNGRNCLGRTQNTELFGDNETYLEDGLTYYFTVRAVDVLGNREPWANLSQDSERITSTTVDTIKPDIHLRAEDQDGNVLPRVEVNENVTQVNLYAWSSDNISGIETTEIEYYLTREGSEHYQRQVCRTDTCNLSVDFEENAILKYRARTLDRALNRNTTDGGNYRWVASHGVANFIVHQLFLTMGSYHQAKVRVRNLRERAQNITLRLTGYENTQFVQKPQQPPIEASSADGSPSLPEDYNITDDGRTLKIFSLNPYEERTFRIKVSSSEPNEYTLSLEAESSTGDTDYDQMTIRTGYPAAFSGLNEVSILVLVMLAAVLYFHRK